MRFVETHTVPAVTVRRVSADGAEGTGASQRLQEQSTSAPWLWRELHQSFIKAPHSAWLQVQIGFPLCSYSTLHLHEVQTSGFNVNRVDFKLNSSLCLCVCICVCEIIFLEYFIAFLNLSLVLHPYNLYWYEICHQ